MAHFGAILFFTGLLVALATILEFMLRADRAAIAAALRGPPRAPGREFRSTRPGALPRRPATS